MQLTIAKIATILGILSTLSVSGAWIYSYHQNFVTKVEQKVTDLDDKIAAAEILVALYELHGLEILDEKEKAKYHRANARLINLFTQRDNILGQGNF